MDNRPIGVFDSGIGGLTVVKAIRRCLPKENIVYFGDTARVPYGSKSANTILRFSLDNTLFLLKKNVKVVVVACNSAASCALDKVKAYFRLPVIGVISGGARQAARASKNSRIGIIATRATVASQAYQRQIKKIRPGAQVFTQACPLFVPLIEEGRTKDKVTETIARDYLSHLIAKKIDTLILGCTHYPLLKPLIARIMGRGVRLIDSAAAVAAEVKDLLTEKDLLRPRNDRPKCDYYFSDPAR
ncbi:MAG: glutamate racemase [Candidatus Omnitrophota bacterium]